MKQEERTLLVKDLCARLPYGVKCLVNYTFNNETTDYKDVHDTQIDTIVTINKNTEEFFCEYLSEWFDLSEFKPYLFPLSSMTEEQIEEAKTYFWKDVDYGKSLVDKGINCFYPCFNILEFYHKYHIDYNGLIEKGLAIDATGLNIY